MSMIDSIRNLFQQPAFVAFLAILACACFYILKAEKKSYSKLIWAAYLAIFAVSFSLFIATAIYRILHPQIWDFTCFYLWGKAAAGGYDFYKPESLHAVYNSLHLPAMSYEGFVDEIVNVGFFYPPPSILYFAPLGYMSYNTALISWTVLNMFFVVASIYLIYSLFFKAYKLNGLLLVAILFFILRPSLSTLNFSQTNFILLFYLLLMVKYQDNKFAGIILALAIFTKPYMFIFVLFFLLRKKWTTILYFIISAVGITGLTFALFGKAPFITYIFDNPVHRMPLSIFTETINQSLHAVLLRHNLITIDKPMLYLSIIGGILIITGIYLLFLLKRKLYDFIWPTLLLVGLLIYAGTLSYYGVLLLFIIFQFFDEKKQSGFNIYLNIGIIGSFYFLSTISVFSSICFLLIVIILKSFRPNITATSNKFI